MRQLTPLTFSRPLSIAHTNSEMKTQLVPLIERKINVNNNDDSNERSAKKWSIHEFFTI